MNRWRQWWRGLGGIVAALAVISITGLPAMDALVCAGDALAGPAAVQSATHVITAGAAASATAEGCAACPGGACAQGHCQLGGLVMAVAPALPAPIASPAADLFEAAAMLKSHASWGLERPPRA